MDVINIESLIAKNKIALIANVDPTTTYVEIGVFQAGNRRRGGDSNAYAYYAMPISEFISAGGNENLGQTLVLGNTTAGTDISMTSGDQLLFNVGAGGSLDSAATLGVRSWLLPDASGTLLLGSGTPGVIPKWDSTTNTLVDGNWQFIVDDIMPIISGSNIGNNILRVGTIFMNGSVIDYTGNATWVNTAVTNMTLTAAGDLGVGVAVPTARIHTRGSTNDNTAFAFKAESLAGTIWFDVRNDGAVNIGALNGAAIDSTLSVVQRSFAFSSIMDVYNANFTKHYIRITDNGAAGTMILGNGTVNIDSYANTVGIGVSSNAFARLRVAGTAAGADIVGFTPSAGNGGFYIRDAANDPILYMQDATAVTKVQIHTSGDSYLNGGKVSMTALPAGPGGLATGDLYVDTASNILAAGDLVVGWKV